MPSTTNDPYLDKAKTLNNTREAPVTINEFKKRSSQMLLTLTPVTKNKETNHTYPRQQPNHIKPILLPVTDRQFYKPSKYMTSILEENDFVRTFDRKRKLLKQVKKIRKFKKPQELCC